MSSEIGAEGLAAKDKEQHRKTQKRPKWMLPWWSPMRLLTACIPCYGCMSPNTAYSLMRNLAGFVLSAYYARIEVVNPWNVPEEGPCIFVINHTNGLVDVALVLSQTYRKVCMMAKAPLFKAPVIGEILKKTGNIPVFRKADNHGEKQNNDGMFAKVYETLGKGDTVAICPEGISHDEAELQPLKVGVALMAFGAMEKYPDKPVNIVPCGLTFFAKDSFRSTVVLRYGEPFKISDFPNMWEEYLKEKDAGVKENSAVTALLKESEKRLREVTVNAPDWDTFIALRTARRMMQPVKVKLAPQDYIEYQRLFATHFTKVVDDPEVQQLKQRIDAYNNELRFMGITDSDVLRGNLNPCLGLVILLFFILRFTILSVLSVPFFVLNWPIAVIVTILTKQAIKGVIKQSFKTGLQKEGYKGLDVVASYNILLSMVLIPLLYLVYSIIAGVLIAKQRLIPVPEAVEGLIWFCVTFVTISVNSWYMLIFVDALKSRAATIRAVSRMTFMFNASTIQEMRTKRRVLQKDVRTAVKRLAPAYYQTEHPLMKEIFAEMNEEEQQIEESDVPGNPVFGRIASHSMQPAR